MIEEMAKDFDGNYEVLVQSEKAALQAEAAESRDLAAALPFVDGDKSLMLSAPSLSDGMTPDDMPGVRTPALGEVNYAMGVQPARKPQIKRKQSYASSSGSPKKKVKAAVREVLSLDSDFEDIRDLTNKENHLSISD